MIPILQTIVMIKSQATNPPLFGFDCRLPGISSHPVSLLDIGECKQENVKPTSSSEWGQVIQLAEVTKVQVQACRVFKSSWVYRCGMHSHQMLVAGPFLNEPESLSTEECEDMIRYKSWALKDGIIIKDLKMNTTTRSTITEEGTLEKDGSCEGTTIHYKGQTYHKSFLQTHIEIQLITYEATVDVSSNSIYLKDDLRCDHDKASCFDNLVGRSNWKPYSGECQKSRPLILYEGLTSIIEGENDYELIHINHEDFLFVSKLNGKTYTCGRTLYTTDYRNIMVLIQSTMNPKIQAQSSNTLHLNPILYTNAKLSYLQYKTITDIRAIYNDVIFQMCTLERKVMENTINILRISPNNVTPLFSSLGRGQIITIRGEAAYITNCPVQAVTLRSSSICYNGLPVVYNNQSMFLTPISRIIVPNVTEVPCTAIDPPLYKVGAGWIAVAPNYVKSSSPAELHPQVSLNMNPSFIHNFAQGGIYSESDIDDYYKSLTHGNSREADIDHIVTSIVKGKPMNYNIMTTLNPEGWTDIAKQHIKAIWGNFLIFGEVMSGMLGIYMVYLIISKVVGMIIRGAALHQLYGCSWQMLGALWSAIAFFFATMENKSKENLKCDDNVFELEVVDQIPPQHVV